MDEKIFNEKDFTKFNEELLMPSLKDILFPNLYLLSKEDYIKQINIVCTFIHKTRNNI